MPPAGEGDELSESESILLDKSFNKFDYFSTTQSENPVNAIEMYDPQ